MNLLDYVALLQTADAQITRESAVLFTVAADAVKEYAQSIEHRVTGNMAESTYRLGPFPVGNGVLEATIQSGAWYADEEVARGGDHDWAQRTTDDQAALLQRLADDLAERAAAVLTGGG